MHTALTPIPFDVTTMTPSAANADWLVVPVFDGEGGSRLSALDPIVGAEATAALGEQRTRRYDIEVVVPRSSEFVPRRLVLAAAGPAAEYGTEVARRLAAACVILARERRIGTLAFVHRLPEGREADAVSGEWLQAEVEGLTLGEFDPGRYRTGKDAQRINPVVSVVLPGGPAAAAAGRAAMERGRLVAHCANLARELVNEPGNLLPPRVLAERAREVAEGTSLSVRILDEREATELGMGLLLGVARGSHEPPRLIVLTHEPALAPAQPVLGLVGKGVTFDTGGISIKSADGMERMKDDMAGGAAVLLAMRAIALLGVPLKVVGVVPAVENMPGGQAIRPGDVLHAASGRSVEVVNTDAEGRLILGDGLWYAQRLGATHLVDIATLTGACMVALGKSAAGIFGRPDDWRDRISKTANERGERGWPMPLYDDYRELLKSEIADTSNSGGRYGGAITAALFVGEFAGQLPWAHIDVAGAAWNEESKPYLPKGPTGIGVRTLTQLALDLAVG
jgi:leucyl aminopeptidase